jgi:hypothetical protein
MPQYSKLKSPIEMGLDIVYSFLFPPANRGDSRNIKPTKKPTKITKPKKYYFV